MEENLPSFTEIPELRSQHPAATEDLFHTLQELMQLFHLKVAGSFQHQMTSTVAERGSRLWLTSEVC